MRATCASLGESSRKDDRLDARTLARLARIDPALLGPVRHRSAKAQIQLTVIRARAALVSTRTALVNAASGLTKSYGERLRKCGTGQMNREIAKGLSQELREALEPLLKEIESLNERIAEYDRRIEKAAKEVYPEVALLQQVKGVGTLIALTYVLTLDDPHRFRRSRAQRFVGDVSHCCVLVGHCSLFPCSDVQGGVSRRQADLGPNSTSPVTALIRQVKMISAN